MESTKVEDKWVNNDQNFEAERVKIEEKHRTEILNLLKSFEFEKKDMGARFRKELEKKESELKKLQQSVVEKEGLSSNEVLVLEEQFHHQRQVEFDKEHSTDTGTNFHVSTKNQSEDGLDGEVIGQGHNTLGEMSNSESNTNNMKSLYELERENKKLKVDLNKSRNQLLELNSQVEDLTQKLRDIEKLFENDIPSDKKEILDQILMSIPRAISSSHDVIESPSNDAEAHGKSLDDVFTSNTADQLHRSNSLLSFQLEELNLENDELKRRVYELEQKLRTTVEEHEIRVAVFNEKLDELVGKFISDQSDENAPEAQKCDGYKMNMVEEINDIRLKKTSTELLEEYVNIVLRQELASPSPDIFDANFCHELQSLEQVLDIEVFDGRVFDEEMKDEVKQVLRDKERELLVAYTLEKLRDEIKHRGMAEMTLEELQKERERDFYVNQAVNEILKVHLGISEDGAGQDGDFDVNEAVNKVLREHLGIKVSDDDSSKGLEKGSMIYDEALEKKSTLQDLDSLKAQKDDLERNLQELHDYFEKERQEWLEKLKGPLQGGPNDPEDKDEIIQRLHAQKVIMEQILNAERFHLSRLYYMEMKEELELCLKQHQFDIKIEKERFVDVWKHHAEVGELYQEILSKETENLQNLQTNTKERNVSGDAPNETGRGEFNREHVRLEQQLPIKLELLELQRRRCRDHKAASLILKQALVAMETAAQEQDTLLFSAGFLNRKSSWSSDEDGGGSPEIEKDISSQLNKEEPRDSEVASPNNSTEAVEGFNRRDDLVDALVKLFEKLLNDQQGPLIDSCTSDSELSEVESSSSKDLPSDDEGYTKKENSENLEDASSTISSPRPSYTEAKPTEDPEGKDSETLDNTQSVSVPIIFKLPPRIENILNIERFNLSRLLRDEYVDKIRRGRQKLRRERAKNEEKNGELVLKFHEQVRALLEDVVFDENGVEGRVVQQRRKLTATPSYDSGIADFVEHDKSKVVKKYKELLERARRDLNRAHRALRARSHAGDDVKDEMARIKRSAKEARNDLEELEEKQTGLDNERDALLGKIKVAQSSAKESSTHDQMKEMEKKIGELYEGKTKAKEEVKDLQRKLLAGTGGEEILQELQEKLKEAKEKNISLEEKISGLQKEIENKDNTFSVKEKKLAEKINELQREIVTGTGGEEILQELREKLKEAKNQNISMEDKNSDLQKEIETKEGTFSGKEEKMTEEINQLQRKLVAGTGEEGILQELQEKLKEAREKNISLEEKISDLQKEFEIKGKTFSGKEMELAEEINELQRKAVAGTGGEEILQELQQKLREAKEHNIVVEEKNCDLQQELKDNENKFSDETKEMEKEINELQRKLMAGTEGEEILQELQEKLKKATEQNICEEERNSDLQKEIEKIEETFSDKENNMKKEIAELQKNLVAGTGGEEILQELQEKLQEAKKQNVVVKEKICNLQKEIKDNKEKFSVKTKEMEEEIHELQKKLVSGTGGEEILSELQDKLEKAKEDCATLEAKCKELDDEAKARDKEFSDEVKERDSEINELQKKLVSGTGGEEILTELQHKLEKAKEDNDILQAKCKELEDGTKTKNKEFSDDVRKKDYEISELQKALVSGTGGEEILADLRDKLTENIEKYASLQTKYTELEVKATITENELRDRIKEMENEIKSLQKQVVAGTGGEEILDEQQEKLKLAREENAELQTKYCKYKNDLEGKGQEFRDDIKRKNEEIFELQRKLVSGTGGEEMLLNLQDKLKDAEQEKCKLNEWCLKLEKKLKQKEKELGDEKEEKAKEMNELQKKLIAGTGGDEVLEELQKKLEGTEREKQALKEKCSKLEDEIREKEMEKTMEKDKTDEEINKLQKKLLSGTRGEEVLEELHEKLKEAKMKNKKLERSCHELEEIVEQKDEELVSKEREVNELQKKIISGTGEEELLEELQEKFKNVKESEKALEKRCDGLEKDLQEKEVEFVNNNEKKQNEIEELQRKLLSGTGSEEVLLDLQEKLNKVCQEKGTLKSKVCELEKDLEKVNLEFEKQLKDKQKEANKLQRDLVNGTGAEDVLEDLQEKLAKADKETKKLKEKCRAQEKCKKQTNLDGDDEKKLKTIEAANKVLENENRAKQEKINELQLKMVQENGGKDELKDLQKDLSEANERNKDLEIRNAELERGRSDSLLGEDGEGNTAALKEENERLKAANAEIVKKLENLQNDFGNGTGSEELLQEHQSEIRELSSENKQLRKKGREEENVSIIPLGGRDLNKLEKDLNKANLEKECLISDNESKDEEIADLQRKLIAGSGGEELLENLQQEIKTLNVKNRDLTMHCHDLKEMNKDLMDENEKHGKIEKGLLRVENENDKLVKEIESKDDEIRELQKSIIDGSGGKELLRTLQDKIRETSENNKILEKRCSDLECEIERKEAVGMKDLDLAEAQNEIKRLTRDCEEKDQDIVELQRKLVSGSGGEEVLENLQIQVNNLRKTNSDLDRKLAKARKDGMLLESLENKGKVLGRSVKRKAPYDVEPRGDCEFIMASEHGVRLMRKDASSSENSGNSPVVDVDLDTTFLCDQAEVTDTPSYEECLQMIPQMQEEKEHWREKYKALRMKVGEQFVDLIPDVWTEEATLEEEREKTLLQLSELRQEISEKETRLMQTVSDKERVETELKKVNDKLKICDGNLERLSNLYKEKKLVEKNEEKLVERLHELGLTHDPDTVLGECSNSRKNREVCEEKMIQEGSDITALERKVSQLCHELEELEAEEQSLENGQKFESQENRIASLVNDKTETKNEIKQIEKAINDLHKCISPETHTEPNQSYSKPNRNLEGAASDDDEFVTINDQLEKLQQEINLLQSSLETPGVSSDQEIYNLLALMKEKSKLEDELTDTEKSLNQLGKRDYEALVKERQTQERVARKLMDLTRDKEVADGELQELDALVKEKEAELLKSFNAELKSKEIPDTSSKKRRGFRRKKSSLELKSDASSSEEGSFSEVDLGDPPLSSEATLALSEELGSLIQKKSSLAVRLEGLRKEITGQSLKVEKSLLGVKDDPSEEPSLASSFASIEDLSQSQMSIFDDFDMIDELSLATSVVKEERVKRKSSRKAPMSKLLKEKSTLEKKLKDLQGRVLVQNTKVKNSLREGKDAVKAKEKFVQAVEERKAVENELLKVCTRIDDLASEEGSFKEKTGKKGKTPEKKSGKSLSKNDKRRLLSQRESLRQQLENIKKKIENFRLDGENAGLADFPEMREVGSIKNTVERLRELIAREAELKRDLSKLTTKKDLEMIKESLDRELLNNGGELGKYDDKENKTSDSGSLDESEEGELTEIVKELEDQGKRLPPADEDHQTGDGLRTTQKEDDLNADADVGKVDVVDKDATNQKTFSVSSHGPYSKDSKRSSEHNVAESPSPYLDVMNLFIKEKAKKEAKLHDLEKAIENEKSRDSKTKDVSLVFQRKRQDLKNKIAEALKEVKQRKEALDESKDLLRKSFKEDNEDSEELLRKDYILLTQQKEELDKRLAAIQDELDKQSETGEGFRDISAEYQNYKELKTKEEELAKRMENINEKLRKRKEWAAIDQPKEDHTNLAETYGDILKRMSEENLNMADLIHELEETRETLSKEREITSELLDLIKSRVGNELLEALMGEGLQCPTVEIREMGIIGEEGYQELVDKVENDSITVAEIIDDYKKANQYLYQENQKLHEKIELLKTKVDEDLLASIVDHLEYGDIDISKKRAISKILENNKTLFEQIVSGAGNQNEANEELVLIMKDEIKSSKMELEGDRTEIDKEEVMEGDLKQKVNSISQEFDEAQKRRKELERELQNIEEYREKEKEDHASSTTKSGGSSEKFNEPENLLSLAMDRDESVQREKDKIFEEIKSKLQEAKDLGGKLDDEVQKLKENLADNEDVSEVDDQIDEALKRREGFGNGIKEECSIEGEASRISEEDRGYHEEIKAFTQDGVVLKEKISSVENLQETYVACLDEVQELQQALKRNLNGKKLDSVVKEIAVKEKSFSRNKDEVQTKHPNAFEGMDKKNSPLNEEFGQTGAENVENDLVNDKDTEELMSKSKKVEPRNNNVELSKEAQELKCLPDEIERVLAELNESNKERDEIVKELKILRRENKATEATLESMQKEKDELKGMVDDLQNDKEDLSTKLIENSKTKEEIVVQLKNLEEVNKSLKEMVSSLEQENNELKEKLRELKIENKEIVAKLGETNEVEDFEAENKFPEVTTSLKKKENNEMQDKISGRGLQSENKSIAAKLNEASKSNEEIVKDVKGLEIEKKSLKEMPGLQKMVNKDLQEKRGYAQNENEEITGKLNEASERNKKIAKDVKDIEREKKSVEEMVGLLKKENNNLQEEICNLQNETVKLLEKLNEADKKRKEDLEDLDNYEKKNKSLEVRAGILDKENKELSDEIRDLKTENEEIVIKLNEANEALKQNKENQKALRDLEKENESLKEMSGLLEQENNGIIPKMEELQKLRKDLEDEIEYLRKEEKDFESLKEQLKKAEDERENIEKELGVLKRGKKEVEDFVHEILNQDIDNGVNSALEKYSKNYEKTKQENIIFKNEVEKFKKLRSIVGANLSKKLLELSNEEVVFNDTENDPKSAEKLVKDKNTVARILKEFEDDLENVKQHLGVELFSIITGKDTGFDHKESEFPLKMMNELKNGKHIIDIVKEYEDLINSQASDLENVEYLQQKINMLENELEELKKQRNVFVESKVGDEGKTSDRDDGTNQSEFGAEKRGEKNFGQEWGEGPVKSSKITMLEAIEADDENFKSSKGYENEGIENENQDLLKKVIEHQNEIEEAEELLRKQKEEHDAEKRNMVEQFNVEKTNMQRLMNNERSSMEKAMQNLINEIVRLKEERNEIRKSYRLEKEKLVTAFEDERAESLSKNEVAKNEIQEKLEKKFQDDLEKAKKEMASREAELKEELAKLKSGRNALLSKVAEMENKLGNEVAITEEIEKSWTLKESESRQQIKNEFEEKMNVEKKRFQETLNSLRQEIERLQKEKSKAINGISKERERGFKETADVSANEALLYERLESEFRAKTNFEKMLMEGRIKELRKENEVLNQQKQELKNSMRMERLEMSKKHEREKEELAEKYRNELKTSKKNLEKKQTSQESSTLPTQNFLELRKRIRERDTKIKRYEMFFRELNEEASILQRDPDMAM